MSDKEEVKLDPPEPMQYFITKAHYLQVEGSNRPQYIEATPDNPTLVTLPAGMKPSSNMTMYKPDKPIPHRPTKGPPIQPAKPPKGGGGKPDGSRAADR